MEIKKFEKQETTIVEKTPVVEEKVEEKVENIETIEKFENFEPINEAITYYEDMTLEEKVEHLNERLRNIETRI